MDQYIEYASTFIQSHQEWAGLIIGLLTMGESLLIIGLAIPATALLMLVGGLVGSGTLEPAPVVIWGIAGAVLGDAISYYIGHLLGPKIIHSWPLNKQRRAVARARLFFYKYGMLTIFAGRFLGPLRSVVPSVAGVIRMPHLRFQLANIASAIIWVPVMLLPGYLAGRSVDAMHGNGMNLSLIFSTVLSVILALWIARAMVRKRRTPPTHKPQDKT
ncbi:DedA family protein [Pollutimonas harenae]|uniref:DedA family protein n=1 Tax=Pollutimonas harenae TaxID=657015 RepID=A0A853H3S6_9BURK|nr:DedA family protein [Pollutimonas harenae]NYT86680.1 DedA family protein [Pollutimonas harenae]TEA71334.1 DedA family protein [Pollutimonas harenae]